jgi:hypothetical protein
VESIVDIDLRRLQNSAVLFFLAIHGSGLLRETSNGDRVRHLPIAE